MSEIFVDNFGVLGLIVGMFCLIFFNRALDKRVERDFLVFLILVLVLDFADMGDWIFSQSVDTIKWRYLTSAVGYAIRPATGAVIIGIFQRRRERRLIYWIPAVVNAVLAFSSPFTKLIFSFSAMNTFQPGPLRYLPHIVSIFYILYLLYLMLRYCGMNDVSEIVIVLFVIGINIAAILITVLASLGNEKNPVIHALIISCTVYYIYMYIEVYRRDVLTGLSNRRSFYQDAEKMKESQLAIISMDLNGLKQLNDTGGHVAGDLALKTVSSVCIRTGGKRFRWYRTGGDEFMALGRKCSAEEAREYIEHIVTELKKTPYMASFGYAMYSGNGDFDQFCNQADAMMYEDKINYQHRGVRRIT